MGNDLVLHYGHLKKKKNSIHKEKGERKKLSTIESKTKEKESKAMSRERGNAQKNEG